MSNLPHALRALQQYCWQLFSSGTSSSKGSSTSTSKALIVRVLGWWAFAITLPVLLLHVLFTDTHPDDRLQQFYSRSNQIQALSLGGSHTRALHFPSMGLDGYSLADDGGDIQIAELKLRLAADYLPNLKYVFLTISPGFLSYNRILGVPDSFPAAELRYMPFPQSIGSLGLSDLGLMFRAQVLSLRDQLLEVNRRSKEAIATFIRGAKNDDGTSEGDCHFPDNPKGHRHEDGIMDGFGRTPVASACMTIEYERRDATRRMKTFRKSLAEAPSARQMNFALLERMAAAAKAHGAELILAVSPTTKHYFNDSRLQKFWSEERRYFEKLAKLDHVRIIGAHDIFFDKPYRENNLWFSDPDHVTLEGAKIYSRQLMSSLQKERK